MMWKRPLLPLTLFALLAWGAAQIAANPNATTLPADWFYESDQSSADLGYAVSSGDFNGDGFSDVIAGAPKYAIASTKGGAVFGFYGSAGDLPSHPDWVFGLDASGAELGTAVAHVGDVNNDTYDDLVVTAPGCTNPEPKEGCAFLFLGSDSGLSATPHQTLQQDQRDAYLGTAVAAAGDVNKDGYADVLVGAKWYTQSHDKEGAVFLFLGEAGGLNPTPAWQIVGNQASVGLGISVAGVGDVNGDSWDDVLVGAPYFDGPAGADSGYVALYLGSGTGFGATPAWELTGAHAGARLGQSVAAAGDVNGDGLPDFIVGAPNWLDAQDRQVGAAFVFAGTADWSDVSPLWTAVSDQPLSLFGFAVHGAGDMNQDGFADLAVGAHQYTHDQSEEGAIFIYLGSPSGPGLSPHWTAEGNKADTQFGFAVAPANNVNQDDYADLLVGAPEYRNQTELRGRAFLFLGRDADAPTNFIYLPLMQK